MTSDEALSKKRKEQEKSLQCPFCWQERDTKLQLSRHMERHGYLVAEKLAELIANIEKNFTANSKIEALIEKLKHNTRWVRYTDEEYIQMLKELLGKDDE